MQRFRIEIVITVDGDEQAARGAQTALKMSLAGVISRAKGVSGFSFERSTIKDVETDAIIVG